MRPESLLGFASPDRPSATRALAGTPPCPRLPPPLATLHRYPGPAPALARLAPRHKSRALFRHLGPLAFQTGEVILGTITERRNRQARVLGIRAKSFIKLAYLAPNLIHVLLRGPRHDVEYHCGEHGTNEVCRRPQVLAMQLVALQAKVRDPR